MNETLHSDIVSLAFLLGTWRGRGSGGYPTIESFEYEEQLQFTHVGKPYLIFRQETWRLLDGLRDARSHMELAFWRPQPDGGLEVISTHPNGVVEIEVGFIKDGRIVLASGAVARSPTAKAVTRMERTFTIDGDRLAYDVRMEAVGQPINEHVHAELRREQD
jgi:nitrobindin-like protein